MRWVSVLHLFVVAFYFSDATTISEGIDFFLHPKEKPQSTGTTFIFGFISSHFSAADVEYLSVLVSNQDPVQSAQIEITSSFPTFTPISVTVPPNNVTRISINPPNLQAQFPNTQTGILGVTTTENKGLMLTSSIPVTVNTDNEHYQGVSSDSMLVLPVCQLGTSYESFNDNTATFATNSMFSVVAIENGTFVRFPNVLGLWQNITLNRLQMLTYSSTLFQLTGTEIETNKPVAAMTGVLCGIGMDNNNVCDHEVEMLLPSNSWGTQFAFVTFAGSSRNEYVLSANQETRVYNDQNLIATMQSFNYLVFNATNSYIWADKPVEVVHVGKRTEGTVRHGAPFFVNVPAIEQFISGPVLFATNANLANNTAHYVHIVTTMPFIGTIAIDGYTPNPLLYTRVGRGTLYFFRQKIDPGQHWVVPASSNTKYAAVVYGMGDSTGYGFLAGIDLPAINGPCSATKWKSFLS